MNENSDYILDQPPFSLRWEIFIKENTWSYDGGFIEIKKNTDPDVQRERLLGEERVVQVVYQIKDHKEQ